MEFGCPTLTCLHVHWHLIAVKKSLNPFRDSSPALTRLLVECSSKITEIRSAPRHRILAS